MTSANRRVLKVGLVAIGLIVGAAATAYAVVIPVTPTTGTVYGCYNTKNGKSLRFINQSTVCKPAETRLEWIQIPREAFVPATGTPTENGTALLAVAASITGDLEHPHTLRLDDGEYNVGATTLNLSGIVLEGRSTDNTILSGTGSASFSQTVGGTLRTDSDVRNLTVKNTGGNTYAAGIVFVGTVGRITDVNVDVSGGTNAYGVTNAFGDVAFGTVRVTATGNAEAAALLNDLGGLGAHSRVSNSKLVGNSIAPGQGEGIRSSQGFEVRVSGSVVFGTSYYANAQVGSAQILFRNSALSGGTSGLVACRGTSTASGFFDASCPTEAWNVNAD